LICPVSTKVKEIWMMLFSAKEIWMMLHGERTGVAQDILIGWETLGYRIVGCRFVENSHHSNTFGLQVQGLLL
jgi:hypothetical protein